MFKKIFIALSSLAGLALLALAIWFAKTWFTVGPPTREEQAEYLSRPHMQLATFKFNPDSPLASRLGPPPQAALDFLRKNDNAPDYEAYTPSKEELRLAADLLAKFPLQRQLRQRLLGVYFVRNFRGNGLTTPLFAETGPVYAWVAVNPASFSKSLAQVLSEREQSVFRGGADFVKVECRKAGGRELPGLAYTLGHELAHVLDYTAGITPYASEDFYIMKNLTLPTPGTTFASWTDYSKLEPGQDSPLRAKLRFYGLNGGPLLGKDDAGPLYDWLSASPFFTLYGAQSWAEDVAEKIGYAYLSSLADDQAACSAWYAKDGQWTKVYPDSRAYQEASDLFTKLQTLAR